MANQELTDLEKQELLDALKSRFEKHVDRHPAVSWEQVTEKLNVNEKALISLYEMEQSGGEPDVVYFDEASGAFHFYDCSKESPKGRRGTCFDQAAREGRKKFPPERSAAEMAAAMGVELLDEEQYRYLQTLGEFDLKTSSWIATPEAIRTLGGAMFADRRYGKVFVYHNGADSYYAARGWRGMLRV